MSEKNSFFTHLIETGEFRISEDGHALLFGEYFFLMPPRVVVRLQEHLVEELGGERAREILVDLGRYQVHSALERYQERLGIQEVSKDEIIDFSMDIMSILGLGDIRIVRVKDGEAVFEIKKPTMAITYRDILGEADAPIDHYVGGILEEMCADIILREECTVEEKECVAAGDERCLFVGRTD